MLAEVISGPTRPPVDAVGVVLAGGLGRRMGGVSKPAVELGGKALATWPLRALAPLCDSLAVVCKADTALPELPAGVARWDEPAEPRHPLTGIVHALEQARAPVLVCAADMPFVTTAALAAVAGGRGDALACVARAAGRLQPVLALYTPDALPLLRGAGEDTPLTATVRRLEPAIVDVPERDAISIDTPAGLRRAERLLGGTVSASGSARSPRARR